MGHALTLVVAAFLLFDAVLHLAGPQVVTDSFASLGFPGYAARLSGVLELVFVGLLLVRRTSVLGALLLTAYLGGVFAAQLRVEAPVGSTLLFSVYVCVVLWVGQALRTPSVRGLLVHGR